VIALEGAVALADEAIAAGMRAGARAAGAREDRGSGPGMQVEAMIIAQRSALTRFADFRIHQNVADDEVWLSLRVITEGRTGVAVTNAVEPERFDDLADTAVTFALASPADKDLVSLPSPDPEPTSQDDAGLWVEATAAATPARRAAFIREVFETSRDAGISPAGSMSTEEALLVVVNSLGVRRAARVTEAESSVVCTLPGGETGWAETFGRDIDALDPAALTRRAAEKALAAKDAEAVDPGAWTVVLEPAATAELIGLLSYCGFGALAEQEGSSFLSGRLGERITGKAVTVVDDATEPRTMALPFDFEGVQKRPVALLERGVAVGVVHDTYTAVRAQTRSTGHALPAPNSYGPFATSLVMSPGDSSLDELIEGTERGLLVTRFFYTNLLDPRQTTFTGMTRDGLYRIEGGKIVGAAKNMRVTDSVLGALERITSMSAEREAHRATVGTVLAPAVRIDGLNFSSGTEF
jgi:predicted Zn-dependent protease